MCIRMTRRQVQIWRIAAGATLVVGFAAAMDAPARADLPPPWDDNYFFAALPSVPNLDERDDPGDRYGAVALASETVPQENGDGSPEEAGGAAAPRRKRRSRRRRRAPGTA